MQGQLKENECNRKIAEAQSLNPHFPFPNRIDLWVGFKPILIFGLFWAVLGRFCSNMANKSKIDFLGGLQV